jgi:hypothetical protein
MKSATVVERWQDFSGTKQTTFVVDLQNHTQTLQICEKANP